MAMSREIPLKLYGERNTGTNYIETLLAKNLQVSVLPGRVPNSHLPTMLTRYARNVIPDGDHWHEWARDRYFRLNFKDNLGWKHMCPSPERIGAARLAQVRFIMVLKNPYAWLLSLFRNPYHVGGRDDNVLNFLDRRLPVMEMRENTGPEALTPVEVWNRKGRGYLALREVASHAMLVQYEDFLRGEDQMIGVICAELGLTRTEALQSVPSGVKRGDRDTSHTKYVDYYLDEAWRSELTPEAIAKINTRLDPELTETFGYHMIAPEEG